MRGRLAWDGPGSLRTVGEEESPGGRSVREAASKDGAENKAAIKEPEKKVGDKSVDSQESVLAREAKESLTQGNWEK